MLLALPTAWLRVRRKPTWTSRPREGRNFDLMVLGEFVMRPVCVGIFLAWLTLAVITIAGWEPSTQDLFVLVWGPPTIFVPLAVLRLDASRLPNVIAEMEGHRASPAGTEGGEQAD